MAKSICQMTEALDKLLPVAGEEVKEAGTKIIDSTTLLGQAMIKTTHLRKRFMTKDVNPTYKRMAFETGPVKRKLLYDDLAKSMKDAYVTGKISSKTKNYRPRPFHQNRKRSGMRNSIYNSNNQRYQPNKKFKEH